MVSMCEGLEDVSALDWKATEGLEDMRGAAMATGFEPEGFYEHKPGPFTAHQVFQPAPPHLSIPCTFPAPSYPLTG